MLNDISLPELFSEEFDETRALWHKNKQTALSRALDLGPLSLPNDKTSIVNNNGVACLKIPSNVRGNFLFDFYDNPDKFNVSTQFVKSHYGKGKTVLYSLWEYGSIFKDKFIYEAVFKNKFMIDKCVDEMAGNIIISGDNEQNTYAWDTRTFRSISSLKREFNNMKVDCSGFNTFDALKLLAYEKLNGHTVQYGKLSSIVDENTNSLIVGSGNAADAKILEIFFLEAFYRGTLRVSVELCEDDFAFNKQFLVFYDIRDLSVRQVKKIRNDKYKNEKWQQSVDSKIQSLKKNRCFV